MFDNFAALASAAATHTIAYGLQDVPDAELPAYGEPGVVVLISRCEHRMSRLVRQKAAGDGAAEREDLQQAAMLGFLEALRKYDPARGVEPFTYAYRFIDGALMEANAAASPKPVQSTAHARYYRAMAAMDKDAGRAREWSRLQRLTGFALQDEADEGNTLAADVLDERIAKWERKRLDVATCMGETGRGLEPATFDEIHEAVSYVSVDAPLSDAEGEAGTLHDVIADEAASAAVASVEDRAAVVSLLSALSDRDAAILRALFGIDVPERTAVELSDEYGVSAIRIRGIKRDAVRRLAKVAA